MKKSYHNFYTTGATKWLLSLVLFFSAFSFTGYSHSSNTFKAQAVKTEMVFTAATKRHKRAVAFRSAFNRLFTYFDLITFYKTLVRIFNSGVKIQMAQLARQVRPSPALQNFQHRIIPLRSDEPALSV